MQPSLQPFLKNYKIDKTLKFKNVKTNKTILFAEIQKKT